MILHAPIDPSGFDGRKAMALAVCGVVAEGAGALRQNRMVARAGSGVAGGSAFA